MIVAPISFINTGVPLIALTALAIFLPRALVNKTTLSQYALARSILISAILLAAISAAILGVVNQWQGLDVVGALGVDPLATIGQLFKASFKAVLFWAPMLALVWFLLATDVEKRRGEFLAKAPK